MARTRIGKFGASLLAGAVLAGGVAATSPSWAALNVYLVSVQGTSGNAASTKQPYTGLTLRWVDKATGVEVPLGAGEVQWSTGPQFDAGGVYTSTADLTGDNAVLRITMPSCNGTADVYYYVNSGVNRTTANRASATVVDGTTPNPIQVPSRKPCKPLAPTLQSSANDEYININMNGGLSNGGNNLAGTVMQFLNLAQGYASWQKVTDGSNATYVFTSEATGQGIISVYWGLMCYDWIKAPDVATCDAHNQTKGYVGMSTVPSGNYGFRVIEKNFSGSAPVTDTFTFTTP